MYFWAARPQFDNPEEWRAQAALGVIQSDNYATGAIWKRGGGAALLELVGALTGVQWQCDPSGEGTFGSVLVRASEVVTAYQALVNAARTGDNAASEIIAFMRQVPERQTHGARSAAARTLGIGPSLIATKTGWFCDKDESPILLRSHAVTISTVGSAVYVAAVTTGFLETEAVAQEYDDIYEAGGDLLPFHFGAPQARIESEMASVLNALQRGDQSKVS